MPLILGRIAFNPRCVVAVFVLNVIVLFVSLFFCLRDDVLSFRVYVCRICDPNMSLCIPHIYFVCVCIWCRLFQRLYCK